jgi:formate hydrogenlyase subunit 3/multisubunit Na+/H+ antiporter MnhD subunit
MGGILTLLAGIWLYLAAVGKVQMNPDKIKSEEWRNKFGTVWKIAAPILIIFGVLRLYSASF